MHFHSSGSPTGPLPGRGRLLPTKPPGFRTLCHRISEVPYPAACSRVRPYVTWIIWTVLIVCNVLTILGVIDDHMISLVRVKIVNIYSVLIQNHRKSSM